MLDGIFNYDNKFFRAVNKLADLVILSFCWLISCIPIFTIGAASSALYSAVHKSIRRGKGMSGVDTGVHSGAISSRLQRHG